MPEVPEARAREHKALPKWWSTAVNPDQQFEAGGLLLAYESVSKQKKSNKSHTHVF